MTSHTAKLTPAQAETLRGLLAKRDFDTADVPHAVYSFKHPGLSVTFYKSGKLLAQGKGTREFVEFTLEPAVLGEATLGYELETQPEQLEPRLGVDESGKGDFFGPLVVAGVYVNEPIARALHELGVKDSKAITTDKKIAVLAKAIRETPGCVHTVVPIGNATYNRMHQSMRNVNKILAWGHARVIENLLGQRARMEPPPLRAISDQFVDGGGPPTRVGANAQGRVRHRGGRRVDSCAGGIRQSSRRAWPGVRPRTAQRSLVKSGRRRRDIPQKIWDKKTGRGRQAPLPHHPKNPSQTRPS